MLTQYMAEKEMLPPVLDGDYETICQPIDYYGLNFYNGLYDNVEEERRRKRENAGGGNYQDRPETHTEVLPDVLRMLREKYKINIPIIITENGTPQVGSHDMAALLDDQERINYIQGVLRVLRYAMDEGADVRGYYLWSLMDNFEWSAGFTHRFGLYYTDYETLERIPKKSAKWYGRVISENGFTV